MPRPEHGYCVDDVARALVVVVPRAGPRELVGPATSATWLPARRAVRSTARSATACGSDRRLARTSRGTEDWWGRALWGLGTPRPRGAGHACVAHAALAAFERGARLRSPWSRSMAFAALGAAEVLPRRTRTTRRPAACSPTRRP